MIPRLTFAASLVAIALATVVATCRAGEPAALPSIEDVDAVAAEPGPAALRAELDRLAAIPGYEALWRAAYAAFSLASRDDLSGDERGRAADRGLDLAGRARDAEPRRPEGHYVYALNLGRWLEGHKLRAMSRVGDLIAAADRVNAIDERFAHGGGHRILAILYASAPSFIGPGDSKKARAHLDRMLAIDAEFVPNRIAAARTYQELGEKDAARRELKKARALAEVTTTDPVLRRRWAAQAEEIEKKR